jgi:hypothetical protein
LARRNLVILRAGVRSVHLTWLGDITARDWDLFVSPYQPTAFSHEPGVVVGATIPGQKWTGLVRLLQEWPAYRHWSDYERIWLPDDDLFLPQGQINLLFELSRTLRAKLSAPALHERSFYSHIVTMRNTSFVARATNFVEVMMPCFEAATLRQLLPTLSQTTTGFGWGLDFIWPKLLGNQGIYIIDAVAALHTRPVSAARSGNQSDLALQEMHVILQPYGPPEIGRTLAGLDSALGLIAEDDPRFMGFLLRGWSYLVEPSPQLMAAILAMQGYRR